MVGWGVFILFFICFIFLSKDKHLKLSARWIFLVFIIFFSGFRYRIGWDYDSYTRMFFKTNELELVEPSWRLLILILNHLTNNVQSLFFISSALIFILIFKFIYTYSPAPVISLFIFLCFPFFFPESLSVLRQYIAIGIFLFSYKYILERKFLKFLLFTIVGMSFHYSAIVVLPFYFLANKKISSYLFVILIISSFFFHTIILWIIPQFSLIERYSAYLSGFELESNSGIDQLVRIIILIILLFTKKGIDYENNLQIRVAYNFFFIGVLIYTSLYFYAPFRRMSYYFMIFELIIMAELYMHYFKDKPYRLKAVLFYLYIFFAILSFGKRWWPQRTDHSGTNTYYEMRFEVNNPIPLKEL